MVSNLSDNLISYSDWHQTKGFTTFRYLEPPQLMVWKSDFFRGSMRFVRVPPYESGVKLTNFVFSWQNGEFWWGQKCCTHLLTQNEELSKKIGAYILIYIRVYANTWHGGRSAPPPPWIGLMKRWICIRCTSTSLTTLGGSYQLPGCGAGVEIRHRETISPDDGILILFLS